MPQPLGDPCNDATSVDGLPAEVQAVESQDGTVRIALTTDTADEPSVLLPDDVFDADPVQVGTRTRLVWSAQYERRLAA